MDNVSFLLHKNLTILNESVKKKSCMALTVIGASAARVGSTWSIIVAIALAVGSGSSGHDVNSMKANRCRRSSRSSIQVTMRLQV